MVEVHNRPASGQAGKIWRYGIVAFGLIVLAALLFWVASSMMTPQPKVETTQDALTGARSSSASPTVN